MPTENRSSNTEMVSVPRELIVRASSTALGMSAKKDRMAAKSELRAILAQPAEQHQGEPVAYLITQPGCSPALVHARDISNPSKYAVPLYTHVDPG